MPLLSKFQNQRRELLNSSAFNNKLSAVTLLMVTLLLTACSSRPLNYTVDPEVILAESVKGNGVTVSVNVLTPSPFTAENAQQQALNADDDFSSRVKQSIVTALGRNDYRISANKHFTDFVLSFDFTQLQAFIETGTIKDELKVDGRLNLVISQKNQKFQKNFSVNKTLTVALKANYAEVTGLVNQVVNELIGMALADQEVQAHLVRKEQAPMFEEEF